MVKVQRLFAKTNLKIPVFETEKSQFKEAKYNEKSYYYDDCGICFSCLAVQRCVAALVWHHWRWSPRILYLSDLWWIILLSGIIVVCTELILEEIKSLKDDIKDKKEGC